MSKKGWVKFGAFGCSFGAGLLNSHTAQMVRFIPSWLPPLTLYAIERMKSESHPERVCSRCLTRIDRVPITLNNFRTEEICMLASAMKRED